MSRKTTKHIKEAMSQDPSAEDDDMLLGGQEDESTGSVDVYGSETDEVSLDDDMSSDAENPDVETTELDADEEVSLDDAAGEEGSSPEELVSQLDALVDQIKSALGVEGGEDMDLGGEGDLDAEMDGAEAAPEGTPEFDLDADEEEPQRPMKEEAAPKPPTNKVPGQKITTNTEFSKPSTANSPRAAKYPTRKPTGEEGVVDMAKVYSLIKAAAHAIKGKANLPAGKGPNGSKPDSQEKQMDLDPLKPLKARSVAEATISKTTEAAIAKMMERDTDGQLSEQFKTDAAEIIRNAVKEHSNKAMDALDKIYVPTIVETYKKKEALLISKLDEYLNYFADTFMEENQIAIEEGLEREIGESFMLGLKSLFEMHHVSMPKGKEDLVQKLHAELAAVNENKTIITKKAIALKKENIRLVREKLVSEASHGLSMNEKAKFEKLAEGIEFTKMDDFARRVKTLRETTFKPAQSDAPKRAMTESVETLVETTQPDAPRDPMDQYLRAIKKKA